MITESDKEHYEMMLDDKDDKDLRDEELEVFREEYNTKVDKVMVTGLIMSVITSIISFIYTVSVVVNKYELIQVDGLKGYIVGLTVIVVVNIVVIVIFNKREDDIFSDPPPLKMILTFVVYLIMTGILTTVAFNYVPYIDVKGKYTVLWLKASLGIPTIIILGTSFILTERLYSEYIRTVGEINDYYKEL